MYTNHDWQVLRCTLHSDITCLEALVVIQERFTMYILIYMYISMWTILFWVLKRNGGYNSTTFLSVCSDCLRESILIETSSWNHQFFSEQIITQKRIFHMVSPQIVVTYLFQHAKLQILLNVFPFFGRVPPFPPPLQLPSNSPPHFWIPPFFPH